MPRPARLNRPGWVYHVISRFIDRDWLLLDQQDRKTYLRFFASALRQSDWRCIAYALMSNHLHFAMVAGEMPMSSWTKSANGGFARWINDKRDRVGPVFASRPTDFEVLPGDVGEVIAYIHNNPVRARVVARASQSDWTSHRAYLGRGQVPDWLCVEEGLARSRFDSPREFDRWITGRDGREPDVDMNAIAQAVRRRGGLNVATPIGEQVAIVARPFARVRPDPGEVVHVVAQLTRTSVEELCSRRRLPRLVESRRVVVRVGKQLGLCGSDIAAVLGISEPAVSQMMRRPLDEGALHHVSVAVQLFRSAPEVKLVKTVPKSAA